METFAYSQLVLTYEDSLDSAVAAGDRALAAQLHQQLLLKRSQSGIFVLGAILGVLGTTTQAFALLKQGDRGPQVTRVQQRLQSLDYFEEEATGYFGNITASAVKRFQSESGLTPDGVVGPSTEAKLFNRPDTPFNEESFLSDSAATQTPFTSSNPFVEDSEASEKPLPSNNPFVEDSETAETPTAKSRSFHSEEKKLPVEILRFSDRGEEVKQLQRQLQARGYSPGSIDGIYGRRTRSAVMQFQRSESLSVDGIAGKETLSSLELIDASSQRLYRTKTKNS